MLVPCHLPFQLEALFMAYVCCFLVRANSPRACDSGTGEGHPVHGHWSGTATWLFPVRPLPTVPCGGGEGGGGEVRARGAVAAGCVVRNAVHS